MQGESFSHLSTVFITTISNSEWRKKIIIIIIIIYDNNIKFRVAKANNNNNNGPFLDLTKERHNKRFTTNIYRRPAFSELGLNFFIRIK